MEQRDARRYSELAYVGCVEVSLHDPDTIYVAATNYKLSDYRPTCSDRTMAVRLGHRSLVISDDEITRVVRADPVRPGLLFVGTETGIFFSMDDGACWRRMESGFPVVPVYDLKIKDGDLVAATHGRSFWVLDDITPLRDAMDQAENVYLHTPRQTYRFRTVWSVGLFSGMAKPMAQHSVSTVQPIQSKLLTAVEKSVALTSGRIRSLAPSSTID